MAHVHLTSRIPYPTSRTPLPAAYQVFADLLAVAVVFK